MKLLFASLFVTSLLVVDIESISYGKFISIKDAPYFLDEPIKFDEYQRPIKLRKIPPRVNETAVVVGLGLQGDAKGLPLILRQTEVPIVNGTVRKLESTGQIDTAFCAGNGTTDASHGDSGDPAVIDGQLAGIVSYGPRCTNYGDHDQDPTVYTRVDAFYDWILNVTGIVY